ncbi:MAG: DUF262 domain-containing protein [Clostridia bacterium]|nr:DUF262 domain-containing protein [Clostridia bacterium]
MKIEMRKIRILDIAEGYRNTEDEGCLGYGGRLNIRPAYQREFVYDEARRNAVIRTIQKGYPLNVMYWVRGEDGKYELMDGQQRTLSFCMYIYNDFPVDSMFFQNLTETEREEILDYEVLVYICEGNDKEKLEWFRTINIQGLELKPQELRNAVYTGAWLTDAKRHFSKSGCAAQKLADKYLTGSANRQDYLETALSWIADRHGWKAEDYMAAHQQDKDCTPLWQYFQCVFNWVETVFPVLRPKLMKGLPWGIYYNKYSVEEYDPDWFERCIQILLMDDDVTSKKGIYQYLLSGDEKYLSIRTFTDSMKTQAYERQGGICPLCEAEGRSRIFYDISEMEADHITPWIDGGKTTAENCQMLCREHNRRKGAK